MSACVEDRQTVDSFRVEFNCCHTIESRMHERHLRCTFARKRRRTSTGGHPWQSSGMAPAPETLDRACGLVDVHVIGAGQVVPSAAYHLQRRVFRHPRLA